MNILFPYKKCNKQLKKNVLICFTKQKGYAIIMIYINMYKWIVANDNGLWLPARFY